MGDVSPLKVRFTNQEDNEVKDVFRETLDKALEAVRSGDVAEIAVSMDQDADGDATIEVTVNRDQSPPIETGPRILKEVTVDDMVADSMGEAMADRGEDR